MPHLIIEASENLKASIKAKNLMSELHKLMLDSELFKVNAIKSRYKFTDEYVIGDKSINSFIYLQVSLLEGRSPEQLKALGESLYKKLQEIFPEEQSLSLELREMPKSHYFH